MSDKLPRGLVLGPRSLCAPTARTPPRPRGRRRPSRRPLCRLWVCCDLRHYRAMHNTHMCTHTPDACVPHLRGCFHVSQQEQQYPCPSWKASWRQVANEPSGQARVGLACFVRFPPPTASLFFKATPDPRPPTGRPTLATRALRAAASSAGQGARTPWFQKLPASRPGEGRKTMAAPSHCVSLRPCPGGSCSPPRPGASLPPRGLHPPARGRSLRAGDTRAPWGPAAWHVHAFLNLF